MPPFHQRAAWLTVQRQGDLGALLGLAQALPLFDDQHRHRQVFPLGDAQDIRGSPPSRRQASVVIGTKVEACSQRVHGCPCCEARRRACINRHCSSGSPISRSASLAEPALMTVASTSKSSPSRCIDAGGTFSRLSRRRPPLGISRSTRSRWAIVDRAPLV